MQTTSFLNSKAFERFEKIFVVVSIVAFAGAILPTNTAEGQGNADANRFNIVIQIVVFPILAFLLAVHGKRVWNAIRSVSWIVVLCGLAAVSAAWSYEPSFTLRRAVILMAFTLFGIYVGGNFEWEEQIRLFGWALLYMVIVSYLVILVAPDYGISHDLHNGAWKGVFSHKNSLGRVIGFGTVFLIFARPKLGPTFLRIGLFAATALLLIFSDSSTALVAVIGCLAAYPCIYILRVRTRRTIPLWAVIIAPLVLALVLAAGNYGVVAGAFGKDPTLSGRTLLWKAVVDAIKQRPVWGYGYSVFWPKPGPETLKVAAAASMGEMPSHAHDGYLDLVLDLGVMGLLVFLYGLVKMIRLALAAVKDDSLTSGAWPLMFIVYFILFNLTESNLLISRAFLWLPFVSIYVALIQSRVLAPSYSRQDALSAEYAPAG